MDEILKALWPCGNRAFALVPLRRFPVHFAEAEALHAVVAASGWRQSHIRFPHMQTALINPFPCNCIGAFSQPSKSVHNTAIVHLSPVDFCVIPRVQRPLSQ